MKKSTLIYCIRGSQILLGLKKRDFGVGKWNGYGGKVHENETPIAAAVRELGEESGIITKESDLEQVALIRFYFDKKPIFECHTYITRVWQNEPVETEEMQPGWYPMSDLPFAEMWAADIQWVPLILSGEKIDADINFNAEGTVVEDFDYKKLELN